MGLCFIDLETTGLQIGVDRIIAVAVAFDDNDTEPFYSLVNPERPIPEEVSKLTGIRDDDVSTAPKFADIAKSLAALIHGSTLVGFNIHNFDLPMLAEEMFRVGIPFDWNAFTVIDCGSIFKKKEERSLSAAVAFYCEGREMVDAHNALADAKATADVFNGQLKMYPDLAKMHTGDLADFSRLGERRLDPAGKIVLRDGKPVYNIGKSKGVPVVDDVGFAYWMLGKDFPETTKAVLRKLLEPDEEPVSNERPRDIPF